MNDGWIKLHRSIMDHPLYHAEPFTRLQAWVDLLLMANIDRRVMLVRGVRIEVERGQVVRSKDYLAGRWRWSRSKVKRYLKLLEDEDMIVQQNTSLISKITVVNYDKFQVDERNLTQQPHRKVTQDVSLQVNQPKMTENSCVSKENEVILKSNEPTEEPTAEPTDGLTAEQADDLQNKNNRIVEEKKIYSPNNSARTRTREGEEEFEAPKVEEVEAYAQEKELKMDAAAFVDYYEARGWMVSNGPMKSWRAAARMWARKFAELKREKYLERKAREKAEAEREAERQRKEAEREARYKRQDEEREAARQRKEAEREAERKRKEAEREAARQQQEAARLAEQEARAAQRKAERLARKQRRAAATASTDGAIGISNGAIENPNGAIENPNGAIGINQEFTHPNTTDYVSTHAYPHRSERAAEREREKAQRDAEFQAFIARQLASNEV